MYVIQNIGGNYLSVSEEVENDQGEVWVECDFSSDLKQALKFHTARAALNEILALDVGGCDVEYCLVKNIGE